VTCPFCPLGAPCYFSDFTRKDTSPFSITRSTTFGYNPGKLATVASSQEIEVVREHEDDDVSSIFQDVMPTEVITVGEMYEMLLQEMDLMTPDNRTILYEYIFGEWQSKRGFFNHIQDVLKERGISMKRATISERLIKGDFTGKTRHSRPGGAAIVEWRAIRTMQDCERFTYRGITTYRRSLSFARKIDNQREERREEQERIMNLPRFPDGTRHPEQLALLLDRIRQHIVYILLFRYMLAIEKAIGFWPIPKSGYTAEHFKRYHDLYEESEDVVAVAEALLEDCNIK
jgi:hypothetical protein